MEIDNGDFRLLSLLKNASIPTLYEVLSTRDKCDINGDSYDKQILGNLIDIATVFDIRKRDEYCAYHILSSYLDAEIIAGPSNPDLITKNGVPVEVKVDIFNESALKQLLRYMEKLNSSTGIACGKRLTAILPENIKFICIRYDRKSGEYVVHEDK